MRPLDYDGGAYFNAAAYEVHHCTRITYTYKVHTVQGGGGRLATYSQCGGLDLHQEKRVTHQHDSLCTQSLHMNI